MKKIRRMKLVVVRWLDAQSGACWADSSDYPAPIPVTTVGMLITKSKSHVVVSGSLCYDGDIGESIAIPMGMVQSIKQLGRIDAECKVPNSEDL